MFDRIAPRYDVLNRLLSLRQDVRWRKKIVDHLPVKDKLIVLDLATGTADVLLTLFQETNHINYAVGLDRARQMLEIGKKKSLSRHYPCYFITGDAMQTPFPAHSFDAITIAFGIRNMLDVSRTLKEMYRLLRSHGRVLILEFSLPKVPWWRQLYLFYFRNILPRIGGVISGDGYAYRYLNQTVETFPYGEEFCRLLTRAGFSNVQHISLSGGIAALYLGDK